MTYTSGRTVSYYVRGTSGSVDTVEVRGGCSSCGRSEDVTYVYDAVGNRTSITDARGGVSQFQYDALNRNVKVIDPLTHETTFEFDGVGNRIKIVDARGGITRTARSARSVCCRC